MAESSGRRALCGGDVSDFLGHSSHHVLCGAGVVLNCCLSQARCQLGIDNTGADLQECADVCAAVEQCGGSCEELSTADSGALGIAECTTCPG